MFYEISETNIYTLTIRHSRQDPKSIDLKALSPLGRYAALMEEPRLGILLYSFLYMQAVKTTCNR